MIFLLVIIAAAAYLIGSVNFSILLSRAVEGRDIRQSGSGNAGATNMLRTYGKKMGILTLVLDILKGVICVLLAKFAAQAVIGAGTADTAAYIAGVSVILGHNFPVYFGFKGGKGVATSLGVVLVLDWKVGLAVAAAAILIMACTRYVSLGSIIGGAVFAAAEVIKGFAAGDAFSVRTVCAVIIGVLLIARHHANIKRLMSGTENKLSFKGGKK